MEAVLVNVGEDETDLSRLLTWVEAGEKVEIARDGVAVARLARVDPPSSVGKRFLGFRGSSAGRVALAEDAEFTDAEFDDMIDGLDVRS